MTIRVVLADDDYLIREGVRRLLELQPDLETVAVCGDLDSLLAAVAEEKPDVVVTDIRMPPSKRPVTSWHRGVPRRHRSERSSK